MTQLHRSIKDIEAAVTPEYINNGMDTFQKMFIDLYTFLLLALYRFEGGGIM